MKNYTKKGVFATKSNFQIPYLRIMKICDYLSNSIQNL